MSLRAVKPDQMLNQLLPDPNDNLHVTVQLKVIPKILLNIGTSYKQLCTNEGTELNFQMTVL